MMESVKLIECPRDAWQGLLRQIPTARKVEYLRALVAAGFRHIDAVSFVSPTAVPQMADSEQVLEQLGSLKDVEIIGNCLNEKSRSVHRPVPWPLCYPYSVRRRFCAKPNHPEENEAVLKSIKTERTKSGCKVAYISISSQYVRRPGGEKSRKRGGGDDCSFGISSISIADTVGSPPELFRDVLRVLRSGTEVR